MKNQMQRLLVGSALLVVLLAVFVWMVGAFGSRVDGIYEKVDHPGMTLILTSGLLSGHQYHESMRDASGTRVSRSGSFQVRKVDEDAFAVTVTYRKDPIGVGDGSFILSRQGGAYLWKGAGEEVSLRKLR